MYHLYHHQHFPKPQPFLVQRIMTSTYPHSNEDQQTLNADIDGEFPEGGWRAWSVVLGAWCAMIPSMGMLNTIGVLDAWIGENQLAALPRPQTAWVVSLYAFFLYIGGSCAGERCQLD